MFPLFQTGNAHYCWITNPWALLIFFIVPVMTMLLFNIIALIRVLVLIRRERKVGACGVLSILNPRASSVQHLGHFRVAHT